jgi:cardiolipin synthase
MLGMWNFVEERIKMNLPNALSVLRLAMIPLYATVFWAGHIRLAFLILLAAGLTDVLDGYIARSRGLVTGLGTVLDPLADKLMMITVMLSLVLSKMIPWAAAVVFFVRDVGMIVGGMYFHFTGKKPVPANGLGKLTTVLLYAAVLAIIFDWPYAVWYLWGVLVFAFFTTIMYVYSIRGSGRLPQVKGKRAHF